MCGTVYGYRREESHAGSAPGLRDIPVLEGHAVHGHTWEQECQGTDR